MFTTSAAFKVAMAKPDRTLTAKGILTYPDSTTQALSAADIVDISITESAGSNLPLGGTHASTLTLKMDNRDGRWNKGGSKLGTKTLDGATVALEIGVLSGASYLYSKLGLFVLESVHGQEQEVTISIKGADYFANKVMTQFIDNLTYPKTVGDILSHAVEQTGLTLKTPTFTNKSVLISTKPTWKDGTNCRDVIGFVAALAGGFARVDRDGLIEIVLLKNSNTYSLTTARYKTLDDTDVKYGEFNAILIDAWEAPDETPQFRIAQTEFLADTPLNSLAISGNPLLSHGGSTFTTLATNIKNSLQGLIFNGGSVRWQGDVSVTTGDKLIVTDKKGDTQNILVLNQTITFDSGHEMQSGNNISSLTEKSASESSMRVFTPDGGIKTSALSGTIKGPQIAKNAISDVHISGISGDKITAGEIDAAVVNVYNINANNINSGYLGANRIAVGSLDASVIVSGTITAEQIGTNEIITNAANIKNAVIGNAKIVDIAAEKITTGKLNADRIETGSLDADKITSGTITALQIGTNEIIANAANIKDAVIGNAKINDISADKIDTGYLDADRIETGSLDAAKLTAGTIKATNIESGAITALQLKAGLITAESGLIANGAIGTVQIADGSITDAKIIALTASKLTAGTINAIDIEVINLKAANITVGTINGMQIAPDAIGSEHIADGAVVADAIAEGVITADKIADGTITGDKIGIGQIVAEKLKLSAHMIY